MTTIYELKEQQQKILDTLFFEIDEENEKLLLQQIGEITGTVEYKLEYLSKILMEAKLLEHARKEALERAQKRHKTAVNAEQRLKDFILESMIGFEIKRIKTDDCTISIQKGRESVYIPENFDASKLPENLRTHYPETFKAKKNDINRLLKNGDDVVGLKLMRGDDVIVVR